KSISSADGQDSETTSNSVRVSAELIVQSSCGCRSGSCLASTSPYSTVRTRSERHNSTRSEDTVPTRSLDDKASTLSELFALRVSAYSPVAASMETTSPQPRPLRKDTTTRSQARSEEHTSELQSRFELVC